MTAVSPPLVHKVAIAPSIQGVKYILLTVMLFSHMIDDNSMSAVRSTLVRKVAIAPWKQGVKCILLTVMLFSHVIDDNLMTTVRSALVRKVAIAPWKQGVKYILLTVMMFSHVIVMVDICLNGITLLLNVVWMEINDHSIKIVETIEEEWLVRLKRSLPYKDLKSDKK